MNLLVKDFLYELKMKSSKGRNSFQAKSFFEFVAYLGLGRARRLVVHVHLWRLIVDCSTATRQQMKDNMAHPDWQNGTCSDESSQHALAFALHRQQPSYFLITVVCGDTARHSKVANLQLTCSVRDLAS